MKNLFENDPFSAKVSWIDVLRYHAEAAAAETAFAFLPQGEEIAATLTYEAFDQRARAIAVMLRERCAAGDRVLLLYPSGLDFLTAFFGCLYAGVVAVPAYPPRANESLRRLTAIVADAGARIALTTSATLRTSQQLTPATLGDPKLVLLATDTVPDSLAADWRSPRVSGETLAFLQYTSGSTGQPKGVMLTHRNLLSNQHMIRQACGHAPGAVIGSWLPLFHDMGLIGIAMQTVYLGGRCYLMPPAAFLQKPLRWLRLISDHRVATSAAPNFAYELCARRITAAECATLDLSSWRTAINGAEPVNGATVARFNAAFAPAGFRARAVSPSYGLAEASLMATFKPAPEGAPTVRKFDPSRLAAHEAVPSKKNTARELVGCGVAVVGTLVSIVDPTTRKLLPEGAIGEIWLRGPNVGQGYWNKPELTREVFGARLAGRVRITHLRTGDLGFLRRGELFVTGRIKDVIILRGQNHYPQDLETTAQAAHPDLRLHGTAAFAVPDGATEAVVVVQEVERTALRRLDVAATTAAIRAALLREHDIGPSAVVLVKPATLPKTSSGKMQRSACREQFLTGSLDVVGEWRRDSAAAADAPPTASPQKTPAVALAGKPDFSALQAWLIARVAAALQVAPATVDSRAPLQSLGLDSLAAVTLSGDLAAHLGCTIAATVVYDFPTIEKLARHFSSAPAELVANPTSASTEEDRSIAIIGIGCRFPGGAISPSAFWELLRRGGDATTEIPAERWDVAGFYDSNPDAPGRMYVKRGAFLESVDGFDPDFFGIAQRDAVAIDPQHRLLLEVAWEALEDAGITPGSAARREAGVFVGVSFDDYARLAAHSGDATRIDAYSALGAARSLAAARISYHLGLQGPSMLVDTLCSSSLLAVHLAVQSLRNGECRLALAGGANLILSPETTIASCKLRALAADGRCKTFDAAADGYARGEGAGVVVLKRLRDALADGDPIVAVIRGSAVNHDGKSNGLTAPNGLAQEALLRKALADAGATSSEVSYVEAHGTGTILGDPIEVQALGRVYGDGHSAENPLLLGAVKTNIGHLEAAAGIAGFIKTALALRHRELPATLHFQKPNPYIPWSELPLQVVDRTTAWPQSTATLAGVSSFGLGGTNVHVLLGAAPPSDAENAPAGLERPQHVFTVSGHTAAAAAANARAWAAHLATHVATPLADLCHTANTARDTFSHRAAFVVETHAGLATQLLRWADEVGAPAPATPPRVAFLFTGQGSHYAGMARELYATQPEFRATVAACAQLFRELLPTPLTDALFASDDTLLGQTLYAQPAIFAVEVALGRLWLSWGIEPAGLFGHSIGEYAAACIAGVFSLEDAARLVAAKARLTDGLPASGAMLAAATSAERLAPKLAVHRDVEFAAFNGPSATTLAGPAEAIAGIVQVLVRAGVSVETLPMNRAFHTRALEPILAEFEQVAAAVTLHAPKIPLVTCMHGYVANDEIVTPRYWARQMREPVQFARGLETLARDLACTVFVEVGPKPTLTSLGQAVLPRNELPGLAWLPSLRPQRSDWSVLLGALAELYQQGIAIDWASFDRGYKRRRLGGCPTYAFQRRRCWLDAPRSSPAAGAATTATSDAIPTFAVQWEAAPLALRAAMPGTWLLVSRDEQLARDLSTALAARQQTLRRISPDALIHANEHSPSGVIAAGLAPSEVFSLARQLLNSSASGARLWLVTRQAVGTGRETTALTLDAAPLAGFARAFALEQPARWGGFFDFDEFNPTTAAAFADELIGASADDFVAWRAATRLVPRLRPHLFASQATVTIRPDRAYLITGGTGALGLAVARWLVDQGARHLALLSRRGPQGTVQTLLAELTARGAAVQLLSADVAIADDVQRALAEIDAGSAPLAGIFHAAGIAGFEPITTLTPGAFDAVLAPKVHGARHLHELTATRSLDLFVLFSSIASVWGSHGQTHYAAANAFLDTLAHERRRLGQTALSVNWGPWAEVGMVAPAAQEQLRRLGLAPLLPAAAIALLGRLIADPAPQVTAAHVDWQRLRPALTLRRAQPLLDAFAVAPAATTARTRSDVIRRIHAADATQRTGILHDYLQRELARVLGRDSGSAIDPAQGFFALGMDSLMAVELRNTLEADLELQLPATIAFDRATLAALQEELTRALFAAPAPQPDSPRVREAAPAAPLSPTEPIAIVGLACRFPGGVSTPAEFWELLRKGDHGLQPVPRDRWSADQHFHPDPEHPGTMYVREFGFIRGAELFDHSFFNLYPREAASMDPQQRILLEAAWEALESAGLANARLRGSATGTFVGVSNNDYAQLLLKSGDASRIDAYFGTGNALNAVAGRVAYTFGLRGPTMVTDTACSSSLVALHQACHSLRAGECQQAIVAGVNLMLTPEPMIALSRARMLAPDGRCKTFDASADGYGRGEGCGVVILQPLSVARASGRPILAVVSGSAVNQDGASSGFTVPNGGAQQELIRRALAQAGRTPQELDYVEAHGTGTPLGDPIEINALAAVVGSARARPLLVGSVKTNIGHLESAAGIAGVIKAVLALQHGAIPAHLNFSRPSPQIAWDKLPIRVPTALTPWTRFPDRPRIAGVSAFGFTGTNAHVILESAPADLAAAAVPVATPQLIPLSARTADALLAQRGHVLAWLDAHPDLSLADIARTLGAGRNHYAIRETYFATTTAELRDQLRHHLRTLAPMPTGAPLPLAFGCAAADAVESAALWERCGLTPAMVIGDGAGVLAAGVLAGIFSRADATRIAADPRVLEALALQPPRVSFAHRTLGRISDAIAASPTWWKAALAGAPLAAGEPLAPHRELALDATAGDAARLRTVADLYRAGYEIDWSSIVTGGRHLPDAPTYPFQRRRHWVDVAVPTTPPAPRRSDPDTLLGQRLVLPGTSEIRFAAEYSRQAGFMAHHRIFGRMIASAAQQISLLLSASRAAFKADACTLSALTFSRAIMLTEDEVRPVQLILKPGPDGRSEARVLSAAPNADDEWLLHVAGTVQPQVETGAAWTNELGSEAATLDGAETYARLASSGYTLGPSFCWIQSGRQEGEKIVASLAPLPGTIDPAGYRLHPGLIDSCFQLIGLCAGLRHDDLQNGDGVYIPATIERVRFHRSPSSLSLTAHARLTETDHRRTHRLRGDIRLLDGDGTLVCEIQGFEARRAPRSLILTDQAAETVDRLYQVAWPEIAASPQRASDQGSWSLVGTSRLAAALANRLKVHGSAISLADFPAPDASHVVLLLDDAAAEPHEQLASRLLGWVQAIVGRTRPPRVWIITRGAQALDADHRPLSIAAGAALGLARIAALEHPELRLALIDLDPAMPAGEDAAVERELFAETDENQIALRGSRRLAARFMPVPPATPRAETPVRLAISQYGNLDTLALKPVPRAALAPGELEIEVRAVGVNFRDVLNALGLLKAHLTTLGIAAEADLPFGGECAGIVRAVGSAVREFQPGDAVLAGLATGSMGSYVKVDARLVVAKPDHLSYAESATLPVTYLTAFYALHTLAKLQPGERVLIHAAAGGVGVAAIHVARLLGADVLATASPAKWPELRALGVTLIGHSRQTDYVREFPRVHVVLNSLVGEHIPGSLNLLYPNGRFVEIGKLGIWTPEQVAARRPDVAYLPFDLVEISRRSPTAIGELLQQLAPHWAAGRLPPLPLQIFPLADAPAAFRFMAQAKHVGKVVLVRPGSPARPRSDGVYLVTGGLGGLGLALGDWLSRSGAGTILLAGRRAPTAEQEATLATWRARGATVEFRAVDLAIDGAATELVARCVSEFGGLQGVFHTAGVLDDGIIAQQTPARLTGVFAAKARAAWELHTATLAQPLDFFVLFSSLAAVLGSPGQATYAAANAALDALAHHRHRLGRPALSINWGPWGEAGMSARLDERDRARLAALGLKPLSNVAGIQGMVDALARDEPQLTVAEFDRRALLAALGRGRVPPLLRQFAGETSDAAASGSLLAQLRAQPPQDRAGFVVSALGTRLAAVLGLAAGETLAADRDLTSLGFDSLTAVELKGWIAGEFRVEVPMQHIAGLSLEGLARAILTDLQLSDPAAPAETVDAIEAVMHADAQLPDDVRPHGSLPALATPRAAFLTGATGFLGAFLLDELLRTTDATVHCLVRAAHAEEGRARVLENLRSYGLNSDVAPERVRVVIGDLAAPQLGLDAAAFDQLAREVDTIYHNGAWLNFFYPYAALKSANVLGTLEVLRLAVRGTVKPVHYVSTSGVFYSRSYRGQTLPETDAAEHCESHALGYSQSKWVAERLVTAASARGVPVTIHRAPFITGHRETGMWNSDDFICRLVRGIVQLGAMPDLSATMDIVPVDYVARAIVRLSQEPSAAGERFHLCAPGEVPWSALAEWLGENGYAVRRESYAEWLARLPALRNTEHPLAPFLPLFLEKSAPDKPTVPEVFLQSAHARLDGSATARRLATAGLHAPEIDRQLWRCYLQALHARNLLPSPRTSPAT